MCTNTCAHEKVQPAVCIDAHVCHRFLLQAPSIGAWWQGFSLAHVPEDPEVRVCLRACVRVHVHMCLLGHACMCVCIYVCMSVCP